MAHASCFNGHYMWNGDGKPVVWAFRVNFFRDFMTSHPDCILGMHREYGDLYDCVNGVPGEDLDCWFCEACEGVAIFVDDLRYDFIRMEDKPSVTLSDVAVWEEYIALRDSDYEVFQEYSENKSPVEAIENYPFKYRYRLSTNKTTFYAFDNKGIVQFGYEQSRVLALTKGRGTAWQK